MCSITSGMFRTFRKFRRPNPRTLPELGFYAMKDYNKWPDMQVIMTKNVLDLPPPISLQDYLQPDGVPGAAEPNSDDIPDGILDTDWVSMYSSEFEEPIIFDDGPVQLSAYPVAICRTGMFSIEGCTSHHLLYLAGVPTHGKHLFLDRGAMFADGVVLGTSQSTNIGEVLGTLNHLICASYHVQANSARHTNLWLIVPQVKYDNSQILEDITSSPQLDEISEAMPETIGNHNESATLINSFIPAVMATRTSKSIQSCTTESVLDFTVRPQLGAHFIITTLCRMSSLPHIFYGLITSARVLIPQLRQAAVSMARMTQLLLISPSFDYDAAMKEDHRDYRPMHRVLHWERKVELKAEVKALRLALNAAALEACVIGYPWNHCAGTEGRQAPTLLSEAGEGNETPAVAAS
ncbi:hypothetical protein FB451DRAFT_1200168 [Mycena latifolia]|nr:hypothetical protein FB451DRAFT_1200168 [Mycena latifolia]